MLLQSIKLLNFRQFRDESITFAEGTDGKNVTIIIGENGTGKTTLAQAFFWCLYGETGFSDKSMLNKVVAMNMRPGQVEKVQVNLELHHGEIDYTLIREQNYQKDYVDRVKADNTTFDIETRDSSGNKMYIKKSQCESEVKNILPKELSRYFFFDGERIEKMSKDISNGKKATDFAEAVKGLLGLNAMYSAIQHFNPRVKVSVISSYEASFNTQSNAKIKECTDAIERYKAEISEIELRIEELDNEIEAARTRRAAKSEEIKQYVEGEELQDKRERLIKHIAEIEKIKSNLYKSVCNIVNNNMSSFFSIALTQRALEMLSNKNYIGKDIPYMHAKTIEYLLEQKVCICGTHLEEGSIPYCRVREWMDYLPPESISTLVRDFKKEAKRRTEGGLDVYAQVKDNLAVVSRQDDDLIDLKDELAGVERSLNSEDVREKVRMLNHEIQVCDQIVRKDQLERDEKIAEKARKESEMQRIDTERRNYTLLDENNRKIEIYRAYAEKIYMELKEAYVVSEAAIRERLQRTINDIFKEIYEGGLYLTIDEKYHISVYATEYHGDVETSTAQSISVIFAFITGIIKMARENQNAADENARLLSAESYPLVMDAPLSAFDKRRIKTVCDTLPRIAEQVVIFIKDTDGELAEEHMGAHIGSTYCLDKKNEFETVLVQRGGNYV